MKIVQLNAENIMRLHAVEITPTGAVVVIGGANAQGKTSVLDSIMMAIGGGRNIPAKPIRRGEKTASITVDLGEFVIERKFSEESGPSLVVRNADGTKVTSPQAMLDKLVSKITFDPLAFMRMDDTEQFVTLARILNLDFKQLDADRLAAYNARTNKNREVDSQQYRVRQAKHFPNAPDKIPDASAVAKRLEEANKWNRENDTARADFAQAKREHSAAYERVEELREQLKHAEETLQDCANNMNGCQEAAAREDVDTTAISEELAGLAEVRSQVEANSNRGEEVKALRKLEGESSALTKKIEGIDATKAKMVSEAKFPVVGMAFGEGQVLLNDLPFSQASDAERLRVSVAMGIAMNPTLKVLLIRDGSLLDAENLHLVGKMAEEANSQVWIERVGDGAECEVIIADGRVQEVRAPKGDK